MATRTKSTEMTVHTESTQIEPEAQTKSITRRRKEPATPTVANQDQGSAILAEELVLAFDPELRSAMLSRLLREKHAIVELATQEEQVSHALEVAKLGALEAARARGIAIARQEQAKKAQKARDEQQKHFIEVELSQLLDSCDYLPFEGMKQTVERFAELVGVKLEWEESGDGQFTCTAKPA